LNKFQDILAFVRVAELGSFTAAARALSISTSAVTKSVTRIERDLGVQLFHRTTRRLHLTEYGAEFFERSLSVLGDLNAAETAIREAHIEPSGLVRISVPPSFGRSTIIPLLNEFYARHPNVNLDLCFKTQTANPIEGGFDLAVHSGRLADSGLVSRILIRGPLRVVASPAYLEKMGVPQAPPDLLNHRCIIGAFGPIWHFSDGRGGVDMMRVSGRFTTDSGDALREAAVAGLGISQATYWLFRDELADGRLVPILNDYEIEAEPISIVFPAHRHVPAKVRAVVDFLLDITRTARDGSNS
jgi:DNA-binding transcriptional LysR family regulator